MPPRTFGNLPAQRGFLAVWMGWVSLGESLGFLAPVACQQLGSQSAPTTMLPILIFAGMFEGALLGWSQAFVLKRRLLPALSVLRWTILTSLAGGVAWLLGLAPREFSKTWMVWHPALQLTVGLFVGVALLGSIGCAQWLELRKHLPRSWRWIPGTALAWMVGLLIFLAIATPLWQPGQPPALIALIGATAGMAMAASMAFITGLVIVRLAQDSEIPKRIPASSSE